AVLPDFFDKVQRNHQLPFLYKPEQTSNQNNVNNLNTYSNNLTIANQFEPELNDCNDLYDKLIVSTKKALELLKEQKTASSYLLAKLRILEYWNDLFLDHYKVKKKEKILSREDSPGPTNNQLENSEANEEPVGNINANDSEH
ncbi:14985_t:CDS:2, partial [Gigaspora margarita]